MVIAVPGDPMECSDHASPGCPGDNCELPDSPRARGDRDRNDCSATADADSSADTDADPFKDAKCALPEPGRSLPVEASPEVPAPADGGRRVDADDDNGRGDTRDASPAAAAAAAAPSDDKRLPEPGRAAYDDLGDVPNAVLGLPDAEPGESLR